MKCFDCADQVKVDCKVYAITRYDGSGDHVLLVLSQEDGSGFSDPSEEITIDLSPREALQLSQKLREHVSLPMKASHLYEDADREAVAAVDDLA